MYLRRIFNVLVPLHSSVVPEDDGGEVVGTGNDARVALLEKINDLNDQGRAEELVDVNDDGTTTQFVASELTEEEQAAKEAELLKDSDGTTQKELERFEGEINGDPATGKDPEKIKIKVNGREMELTQDELIARAQKVEAADQYLIEAARLRREAAEGRQPEQPQTQEDAEAARLVERRALVRAIQMGTEDEAMAAIERLQMLNRPTIDENAITRKIDERLTFKEATAKFAVDYKDIMDDPVLRKMAIQRDQELLQSGDTRAYATRFAEIGNELRSWRDGVVKQFAPKPAEDDPLKDKQQRKASVTPLPKAASTKAPAANADDEDKEESLADTIAKMAQSRGGSQRLRS